MRLRRAGWLAAAAAVAVVVPGAMTAGPASSVTGADLAATAVATVATEEAAAAVPLEVAVEVETYVEHGISGAGVFWSAAGHDIVCEIAFQRLSDEARDMVFTIREHDPDPSATFYRSCVWPDSSRYADHKATYEYHFMNVVVPNADVMVMERDCANYDCVQLAIVRYANYVSMDPGGSESLQTRRANALKFVGHFVGDMHQPVHVGYAHDRGANDIYADFYDEQHQRLHAIWDFHIPNRMGLYDDPVATAHRLGSEITDAQAAEWENFDVVGWSRESYEIVKDLVYDIPDDGRIGDDYFNRAAPIVALRFQQAGVRLAYLLNHAAAGTLAFPSMFEAP